MLTAAAGLVDPADTVKARLQMQGAFPGGVVYRNTAHAFRSVSSVCFISHTSVARISVAYITSTVAGDQLKPGTIA